MYLIQSSYIDEDGEEKDKESDQHVPEINNVSITNKNRKRKLETEAQPSKRIKKEEENFHYLLIKD